MALAMGPPLGYALVFQDEFAQPGRPNPAYWVFEEGFVRNREAQWYQPQNAWVENGRLIIEARRETVPNPHHDPASDDWRRQRPNAEITSASLKTKGKRSWTHGIIEVRARFVPERGLWPAIWTVGDVGPWPKGGEIDIMEYYRDSILANTAWGDGTWDTSITPMRHFLSREPRWGQKFHTWRLDWDADWIRIYLDGELLNETDLRVAINADGRQPFQQPHHLILNLAVGATGGDFSQTKFPSRYEIEYVRVYQRRMMP